MSFGPPNFAREVDLAKRIAGAPPNGTVKGMFIGSVLQITRSKAGSVPTDERFLGFKDYPIGNFIQLMVDCAKLAFPGKPVGEGLRQLGWEAYPTFRNSMAGKVIFSVAGGSWMKALPLAGKSYGVAMNPGSATLRDVTEGRAVIELRDVWNFPASYQLGVFEGAMKAYEIRGKVWVDELSPCNVDLELTWST